MKRRGHAGVDYTLRRIIDAIVANPANALRSIRTRNQAVSAIRWARTLDEQLALGGLAVVKYRFCRSLRA